MQEDGLEVGVEGALPKLGPSSLSLPGSATPHWGVMGAPSGTSARTPPSGPWFRHRPQQALAVAILLAAGVFALRIVDSSAEDAVSVLYVLPVALLALAFGCRVGLGAGLGCVALLVLGSQVTDVTFTPLGWSARITPLVLLGTLVGFASDQLREADERERSYARVALLQREAAEINDGVVQGLAVAKWLLESGQTDRGLEAVRQTMLTTQHLVSRMLSPESPLPGDRLRSQPPGRVEIATEPAAEL